MNVYEEEHCPKSEDGKYLPRLDFAAAAKGFYTDDEEGVVIDLECRYCSMLGNFRIPFEEIMW